MSNEKSGDYVSESLLVKLVGEDLSVVEKTLLQLIGVVSLSAKQLLKLLQTQGINSSVFNAINIFLSNVEGRIHSHQSYMINGHATIGIGLDLFANNPGAMAVLYKAVPDIDWKALFPRMLEGEKLPEKALSDDQVTALLNYTLVGAVTKEYVFVGLAQQLINKLDRFDLADTLFQPCQLLALQSLDFNTPVLIGKDLCNALATMNAKRNPIFPLLEITECSNKNHDAGLQNRRLKEAALFYGQPVLCFKNGRHNIISTTGVLSQFNITQDMAPGEVCRVLPPTLFDKALTSAGKASIHGVLRGGANVVGFTLQSHGVPKNVAYYISQFLYYGSFFSMRFSVHYYYHQMQEMDNTSRCVNALYNAASETGYILGVNAGLQMANKFFNKAGKVLKENSWQRAGKVVESGGAMLTRFGIFASEAFHKGLAPTVTAGVPKLSQRKWEYL